MGLFKLLKGRVRAADLEAANRGLLHDNAALREAKDSACRERNLLVAALSKLFPARLERHPEDDAGWEDDWRWIVFIELPAGQASWHIHDSELPLFGHLEHTGGNTWDGHSVEEKYARLLALPPELYVARRSPNSRTAGELREILGTIHRLVAGSLADFNPTAVEGEVRQELERLHGRAPVRALDELWCLLRPGEDAPRWEKPADVVKAARGLLDELANTREAARPAMELETARKINALCVNWWLAEDGIISLETLPDLGGYTLEELLTAAKVVEAHNNSEAAHHALGGRTIETVCSEEFLAAIYVMLHIRPVPLAADGRWRTRTPS